ncbi:MAG TPA: hypothetical protein PKA53_03605 [Sphingobacterium sp.]|nr:hypothetical protein [Sphingobacterium sp.]
MEERGIFVQMNIDGTVSVTDLLSKYFVPPPIDIEIRDFEADYVGDLLQIIKENGETYFHPDYDFQEYSSLVLFKKSLDVLSSEEMNELERFINNLLDLIALYTEYHWKFVYSQQQQTILQQDITNANEEIKDILNVLSMCEDLSNSEFTLRHRDEYGSVMTPETTQVNDEYKQTMFDYYAQLKYQNFLHRYKLSRLLTTEETNLNIPIFKNNIDVATGTDIEMVIFALQQNSINPSCTTAYFQELVSKLSNYHGKYDPLYEFNKIAVPKMNEFIEDHAHEKYKKKDKHLLLFSMLRIFGYIPDKPKLHVLTGDTDVKEDFIKQLLKK